MKAKLIKILEDIEKRYTEKTNFTPYTIEELDYKCALEKANNKLHKDIEYLKKTIEKCDEEHQAINIIKECLINRAHDTSGIYVERVQGHYEPYYEIKIKEGTHTILTEEQYNALKVVLK